MTRPATPAGLAAGVLVAWLALVLPGHPDQLTWRGLLTPPIELPIILLLLVAIPARSRWLPFVTGVLVLILVVNTVLRGADLASTIAFARPFNPMLDLHLAGAAIRLSAGSLGPAVTALLVAGLLAAPILLGALLWWGLNQWGRLHMSKVGGALAVACTVAAMGTGQARLLQTGTDQVRFYRGLQADLSAFEVEAARDPFRDTPALFDRLAGHDVEVVFVESYGRAAFDNPLYAPRHHNTLRELKAAMTSAGMAMWSGWLASPITGGQSWLAHSTFASGLRIDNQARYNALLASPRQGLFHLAQRSGRQTAVVMPAIVLPWPEADRMGFDRILPAAALGYAGQAFNWTTMPDQYTLSAVDRLLPPTGDLFAMVGLISSHAPWTPVPRLVPRQDIGDGRIFTSETHTGPPAADVWGNFDELRRQYGLAIDYSLRAVAEHVLAHAGNGRLFIVLGDHAPAESVSQIASPDVPVHVIGDEALVAGFQGWGWQEGLTPAPNTPAIPMEDFRDRFVTTFTSAEAFD